MLNAGTQASFRLFIKQREIQSIHDLMSRVQSLPSAERSRWIEENGEVISNAFDMLVDESHHTFEELRLDESSLEISRDVILLLRETLGLVSQMIEKHQSFRS